VQIATELLQYHFYRVEKYFMIFYSIFWSWFIMLTYCFSVILDIGMVGVYNRTFIIFLEISFELKL
jgi:hypothetical protein